MAQPQDIPAGRPSRDTGGPATTQPPRVSMSGISTSIGTHRLQKLSLDTFSPSPVTVNGSYDFDRILKCGFVHKRTRKTKSWKPIYLVLRPTSLSIYKDQRESKLRHKIHLTDLTAVAKLKDPKGKRDNLFGLFSPSRNYHLEASTTKDAEEWVDLIRREARIEEEEEEMFLASPAAVATNYAGLDEAMKKMHKENKSYQHHRVYSSSPEPIDPTGAVRPRNSTSGQQEMGGPTRRPSHFDYSGNEPASHSDMSDAEPHPTFLNNRQHAGVSDISIPENEPMGAAPPRLSFAGRNGSQLSGLNVNVAPAPPPNQPTSPDQDSERVIWQGHLLFLKSNSGVRQWKAIWAVLRAKSFALYKDENEYRPVMVLSTDAILSAVEIDAISRSKKHCLQVITEEKRLRFCAPSEDAADRCLGAFKSILARRNGEGRRADLGIL